MRSSLLVAPTRSVAIVIATVLGALFASGCGDDSAKSTTSKATEPDFEFSQDFGPGPVRLTIRLEKTQIGLSDRLICEQELTVDGGFVAEFPEYLPEDFEGFGVVKISYPAGAPPPPPADDATADAASQGQRSFRKRLTLEPDRSGELAIAPLAVYVREAGKKEEFPFFSDEIKIDVRGLENIDDLSVHEARGIIEAPLLEVKDKRLLWATTSVAIVAALTLLTLLLTRGARPPPPPRPAHEIAYEALALLVEHDFIGRGQVDVFFVHLSLILRRYIEHRFDVHAPERTTEEFLVEASRARTLAQHKDRLGEFLRLCDQIKFATFQPTEEHIQSSFDVVKQFIEETRSDAA